MAGVAETWGGLSVTKQAAIAGGCLAAVTAVVATLYVAVLQPKYQPLYSDLRVADAAAIVDELDKSNVPHKLTDGGATILVPAAEADAARLKIASSDLAQRGVVGFEVFNKTDMGLTEFAQRVNYQRALQGELARTILAIEGVDAVRVHLSITEPGSFGAEVAQPRASVTITPRPGSEVTPDLALGVQRLVSAAAPNLAAEAVVVLNAHGSIVSSEPPKPQPVPSPAASAPVKVAAPILPAMEAHYTAAVEKSVSSALAAAKFTAKVQPLRALTEEERTAWTSADRKFPLRGTLTFETVQTNDDLQLARAAAAGAFGVAVDGDAISVVRASPAPPAAPSVAAPAPTVQAEATATKAIPPAAPERSVNPPALSWLGAAVKAHARTLAFATSILLILTLAALVIASRRRRRLSDDDQERLAESVRTLLSNEGAHAPVR